MQNFEYLQISINYYASTERLATLSNHEDADVWRGVQNYLETLDKQGWMIINETKAVREQSRTYQFKRLVEGNSD